jgi:hypothetical protein
MRASARTRGRSPGRVAVVVRQRDACGRVFEPLDPERLHGQPHGSVVVTEPGGVRSYHAHTRRGETQMDSISRREALRRLSVATGIMALGRPHTVRASRMQDLNARIVAVGIPDASAVSPVGTFLTGSLCGSPIPTKFLAFIQPGAVLDPVRILVGARSNFGAPLASDVGQPGALLSIDPSGPDILRVPPTFASDGHQASALGGRVQMYSANSPFCPNSVHNPSAVTAGYTGVSNPLGLSINNAFGRIWPANTPFGQSGVGSSSILDPDGLPLSGAPNPLIGGVYVGALTNRNHVTNPSEPQVIPGMLSAGAVGTAFLGPSPDRSCRAGRVPPACG